MRENPKAHEIWRHFKNNDYEIITVAEHTETGDPVIRMLRDIVRKDIYWNGKPYFRAVLRRILLVSPEDYIRK